MATTITIRHAEPGDYLAVHQIWKQPRAVWGTLQLPLPPAELWRERLAEPPPGMYTLLACAGDEIVGHLGLHTFPNHPRRRHAGELGMAVRDDWQGKGAGKRLMEAAIDLADNWLNLLRLELSVYTDNDVAIGLYKKFGFVIEGTLLQFAFRGGAYVDAYTMARLRQP